MKAHHESKTVKLKFSSLLVLLIFVFHGMAWSQDINIMPNQPQGTTYCNQMVPVAPNFTMVANSTIDGMKVSFSQGYIYGEDELSLQGSSGPVSGIWSASQGYLVLSGGNNVNDYIQAIRQVYYNNKATHPTNAVRFLTFSLNDADYLPETGHFYKFVPHPGISWTAARDEAASAAKKYHGLQGYLATITSAGENAFIQQKTQGVGWIGASDAALEGEWRWVTGPEGLAGNGSGLLFWLGSGYQAKINPGTYGPVNGAYQNWNRWDVPYSSSLPSTNWEPNNSGGTENYAHITYFPNNPSESLKWNDLPNSGSSGDYLPAGYLIEWGGMDGDPSINLTASIGLMVNSVSFGSDRFFTRCQGDTVRLNQQETQSSYLWRPAAGLSSSIVSNPLAKPNVSTEYTVIATHGLCRDSVKFTVNINPAPVSLLKKVNDICAGDRITLDPGIHAAYTWSTGVQTQTITTTSGGVYSVGLTGSNGCKSKDTVQVVVHQFPRMDLSQLDTLFCGTRSANLKISSDNGTYLLKNLITGEQFSGTSVTVPAYGYYPFSAQVKDPFGCNSDTSMNLQFHKIPNVGLTIDETVCYGYNLQASYIGDVDLPVSRFTWIFGGDTISNKLGQNIEQIPLGVNQSKRDLVLKVTQDGCTGTGTRKDILVIPDLSISVRDSLQCQPKTFFFTATNTENVVRYDWDWGDGTEGSGKLASHLYATYGFYDVNVVVTTDKGCTNSATVKKMVYVAPIPTVGFSIVQGNCLNQGNDTLNYVGSANAMDTFYWDLTGFDPAEVVQSPGATSGPFVFNLINKPKTDLSLYVISQFGCRSTTAALRVKRKPVFSFNSQIQDGCAPVNVDFTGKVDDPVDQLDFNWSFGDGASDSGAQVSHTYDIPNNIYSVGLKAISSVTGCSDSIRKDGYITVHPVPKAGFTMDHDIVYNDMPQVIFSDQSSNAVNFLWDFGDGTHSREQNPTHNYAVVGKRKVLQTVYNQFDCQDTISGTVLVAFNRIFAPNAFSPNASNAIDRVFLLASDGIRQEGYHLTILSRWSDIVFECRNVVKAWDGKMTNGDYAPAGNYIWILECFDFLGRPHRQSGSLTLLF